MLSATWPTMPISKLCEFIDSGRAVPPRRQNGGICAYEVGHIQDGLLLNTDVNVSPETDKLLGMGDILTGRVAGLGQFAVYTSNEPASFSDNTLRIRLTKPQRHRAAYISAFLNSALGRAQLLRDSRGGLQKVVTQESVSRIVVPDMGNHEEKLVAELNAVRAERDRAFAEADALLTSIDTLVTQALGLPTITPPAHFSYAIRFSDAKAASTLSADYFHPERMGALKAIRSLPNAPLSQLVDFQRNLSATPGEARYIGLASVASHTGQLTNAVETAAGQCFEFVADDVLYGRLRPYLNKVWLASFAGVSSTEFHVMRVRDRTALLPAYLAVVMRSQLIVAQTRHMMTGNTHPRLANEDVVNLLVPLTDKPTQQHIVDETIARQSEAARLRTHAETVWRRARERFEQQLLQGSNA